MDILHVHLLCSVSISLLLTLLKICGTNKIGFINQLNYCLHRNALNGRFSIQTYYNLHLKKLLNDVFISS